MLQVPFIRANKAQIVERLKVRNYTADAALDILDKIIAEDDTRKDAQTELDKNLAEAKQIANQIGSLYKQGKRDEADALKTKVSEMKEASKNLESTMKEAAHDCEELLLQVPNVPHPSVPAGNTDEDNEMHQDWIGDLPTVDGEAKPHWELAKQYNLFDLELGAKIAGAGFVLYRGKGARLQRALINFFLDEATKAGYEEVLPPLLVNADSARATGQLPDKEGQMYHCTKDDLYLIPTAEVPVTNIYRDVIIEESDFPIKLTGHTPCFRREAGSYGAHVRGLNRVHQFDKVEIVQIAHPDKSYEVLEEMIEHVKGLLEKLELPYRILRLCGGDLGFTSTLTFDFEVWSAAQERWLEVSSVSNFETFQSNRLKLRYKGADKKKHLAHTLNGSALALARIVAALLENNQTADGILIPKVLQSYTGFEKI
ncbi:MAG: seryl-tRNA synthetase [Paraglaciecola sp.]|jgi:seryl-tRNA synthetase